MQGIFSRQLRKRIDANTLTNGQTNGQTNSQAECNAVPKMARAPQFPHVIQTYTKFARLYFPSFTTFRNQIMHFTNFIMFFLASVFDSLFFTLLRLKFSLTCKLPIIL